MASRAIEDLLKRSPELKSDIQQAGQELDKRGAEQKDINYAPHALEPKGTARPFAPEPTPGLSTAAQKQPNAVDRALSTEDKSKAGEVSQVLEKSGASIQKDNDLER